MRPRRCCPLSSPRDSPWRRSRITRKGTNISAISNAGRRNHQLRRRSSYCPPTRGGCLPSCPPYTRILPLDCGAFRIWRAKSCAIAPTSPTLCDTGSSRPPTNSWAMPALLPPCTSAGNTSSCSRLVPEVNRVLHHCHACQVKSQKARAQKDVHRTSFQAGTPFQVWSKDVFGPLSASSEGHRYLLTLKNVFSKWFWSYTLSNTTSEKVFTGLCKRSLQVIPCRFTRTMPRTSGRRRCKSFQRPVSDSPSRRRTIHSPTLWKGLTAISTPCYESCVTNMPLIGRKCYLPHF